MVCVRDDESACPKVSVILLLKNGASYLADSLRSVVEQGFLRRSKCWSSMRALRSKILVDHFGLLIRCRDTTA